MNNDQPPTPLKKPSPLKKSFLLASLSKWKASNQIWLKSPDYLLSHPFSAYPVLELSVSKKGSFLINTHRRIFHIFDDKIVCFKNSQEKVCQKAHAMIVFDDQLLIHWLYRKAKKQSRDENSALVITGFNFIKGSSFLSFRSSDSQGLMKLKELLKLKLKFMNFQAEFSLIKMIGKGAFSSVYLARNIQSKKYFGVKTFHKRRYYATINGKDSVANEIACMRKASSHRNIIQLHEVFETHQYIYLVLEMVSGGNLQDRLNQNQRYSEKQISGLMKSIFEGIAYIHSKRIMHRDIKPSNILLRTSQDSEDDVCIADFGLATPMDVNSYIFFRCGTAGFAAPEIIENTDPMKKYEAVCDVFSAGAVFHYLLTGKPLFKSKKESLLYINKICRIDFHSKAYKNVSDSAKDLLKKTLEKNPEKRISAKEALGHPFFHPLVKLDSANFLFIPEEKYENFNPTTCSHNYNQSVNCSFSNEKRQNTQESKHILEDLTTNMPVLNGYLDTIEFSDSGTLKSNSCIPKSKRLKQSSFSRSLPRIEKKEELEMEEQKTFYQ